MARKKLTFQFVVRELKRLDPNIKLGDPVFDAALVLLSSAVVGTDVGDIAKFTGIPQREIRPLAKRLRANGVWTKSGKLDVKWDDPKTGGIALWIDVSVALGLMERKAA